MASLVIGELVLEYIWGDPQFFWSCMSPYLTLFIAFVLTNFRNLEFYVRQFFSKISQKFPEIFSTFSKSKKKTIIFAPKIL